MSFFSDFFSGLTDRFGPMAPLLAVVLLDMLLILLALPVVMKRQRDRFREQLLATRLRPLAVPGGYFQLVDYSASSSAA